MQKHSAKLPFNFPMLVYKISDIYTLTEEPMREFESLPSSLPRKRSTPELHRLIFIYRFHSATRSFIGHFLL